jgi:hypothetical protein
LNHQVDRKEGIDRRARTDARPAVELDAIERDSTPLLTNVRRRQRDSPVALTTPRPGAPLRALIQCSAD